jgi:glutathione S-transferase
MADPSQTSQRATGSFTVKMAALPLDDANAPATSGRMSLDKTFDGDLVATANGEMLTAGTATLQLLGKSTSINVRKVLWACHEIGIELDHQPFGSGFASTETPEFLALNPNAMVPVIKDGDFVLWESNSICRYLASAHRRVDLLPADPQQRAVVEQWMDWQATELNNSWRYAFPALARKSPSHTDPSLIEEGVRQWNRHMTILDGQLQKTGAYAAGGDFTLADVVLGLSTNRWFMTPMEKPRLDAVAAYYDRLAERPGFRLHGRNGTP